MEARLLQENQSLMKERAHLNEVLTNLQNMQNELERSEGETARRIQAHAEALERELQTARARLTEESDASKALILRKDADAKEYQGRIDKLVSYLHVSCGSASEGEHAGNWGGRDCV